MFLASAEEKPRAPRRHRWRTGRRGHSYPIQLLGEHRAVPDILAVLDMANPKYAASDKPVPVAELIDTLSDGTKVKRRIPRMRACNEKDAKEKLCAGHLKRWYFFGE